MDSINTFRNLLPETLSCRITSTFKDATILVVSSRLGDEVDVQFNKDGSIIALMDSDDINHVWEILPDVNDLRASIHKMQNMLD